MPTPIYDEQNSPRCTSIDAADAPPRLARAMCRGGSAGLLKARGAARRRVPRKAQPRPAAALALPGARPLFVMVETAGRCAVQRHGRRLPDR